MSMNLKNAAALLDEAADLVEESARDVARQASKAAPVQPDYFGPRSSPAVSAGSFGQVLGYAKALSEHALDLRRRAAELRA
jgi:hypothetical protein